MNGGENAVGFQLNMRRYIEESRIDVRGDDRGDSRIALGKFAVSHFITAR